MSRPKNKRVTHAITINLPPDLAQELQQAAHDRAVSRSLLIEILMREGLTTMVTPREFLFGEIAQAGGGAPGEVRPQVPPDDPSRTLDDRWDGCCFYNGMPCSQDADSCPCECHDQPAEIDSQEVRDDGK